ncbi:MAG: hypothetical protein R3258_06965 [Acidimicrobiia bacterium]|nr:hypothetical protein [Acidimicrobiia bacterium]
MHESKSHTNRLRSLIRANGVFSITSGLILAVGSPLLDMWLGVDVPWLLAIGVALVGYGLSLYSSAGRDETLVRLGRFATVADIGWVLGAAALISLTDALTPGGEIALAAVSAVVLGFAVLQARALPAASAPAAQ